MTSLLAWIAVDKNAPSAFYLASDSRISWGSERRRWDAGRKLFICQTSPDIFGFAGEVVFPALCLGQITAAIDAGLLFRPTDAAEVKHRHIVGAVKASFSRRHDAPEADFSIVHASRVGSRRDATFKLWRLSFAARGHQWIDTEIDVPSHNSAFLLSLGTGTSSIQNHVSRWNSTEQRGTSRAIFSAFCDAIRSGDDVFSGGPPQLIGMYHTRMPQPFGIIWEGNRYFLGFPLPPDIEPSSLEWRDDLFQRINGETLGILIGAQRHVRPR